MKTLREYWDESFQKPEKTPKYDDWLDKYLPELQVERNRPIIDLGCGVGNNALYLNERDCEVTACDISEEALKKIRHFVPGTQTLCFDLSEGLPFADGSIAIVIADLSLHYFTDEVTGRIIDDLNRVLQDRGLLLCRLNSIKDLNRRIHISTGDPYLYQSEGIYRRFFDRREIDRFFDDNYWYVEYIREYVTTRFSNSKTLWEMALRKKGASV